MSATHAAGARAAEDGAGFTRAPPPPPPLRFKGMRGERRRRRSCSCAPAGPSAPMRNPAVEPPAEDDALDAAEQPIERRHDDAANGEVSREGLHPPAARARGVDSETQTSGGNAEWTSLDLRRSLRLLHSTDEAVVKRTLRRLHIRFWHASAAKLTEILRLAGAPRSALRLIKDTVDTCRICRAWQRPTPKSMTSVRMARDFNHLVQWDILFHRRIMISHLLDEAIRLSVGSILADKTPASIISSVANNWIRQIGPCTS